MKSPKYITHYFTFGQEHMSSYFLPGPGKLCDYWVAVRLPKNHPQTHRQYFIEHFTKQYCFRPKQFAMEYNEFTFDRTWFKGELVCLTHIAED